VAHWADGNSARTATNKANRRTNEDEDDNDDEEEWTGERILMDEVVQLLLLLLLFLPTLWLFLLMAATHSALVFVHVVLLNVDDGEEGLLRLKFCAICDGC
jgi:hypothetical protein